MFARYKVHPLFIFIIVSIVSTSILTVLSSNGFFGVPFNLLEIYFAALFSDFYSFIAILFSCLTTGYFLYMTYKKNGNHLGRGLKNYLIHAKFEITVAYIIIFITWLLIKPFGDFFFPMGLSILIPFTMTRLFIIKTEPKQDSSKTTTINND